MTSYEFDPIAGVYRIRRWKVTRPGMFPRWIFAVAIALIWLFGRYQGVN